MKKIWPKMMYSSTFKHLIIAPNNNTNYQKHQIISKILTSVPFSRFEKIIFGPYFFNFYCFGCLKNSNKTDLIIEIG